MHPPPAHIRLPCTTVEPEIALAFPSNAATALLEFAIVKRGLLSTLCYHFGSPRIIVPTVGSLPHVEVESRQRSVYDEAAA